MPGRPTPNLRPSKAQAQAHAVAGALALAAVLAAGPARGAAIIFDPPELPGPLPEVESARYQGYYNAVTNVLVGPFTPGTGKWRTVPNGDFETGLLTTTPGHTAELLGFKSGANPGIHAEVRVATNAACAGRYGAELRIVDRWGPFGATLESNWGFYLEPDTTYVISAFLRLPHQPAPESYFYLDLWEAPGDVDMFARTDTTEWQFVWGLYHSSLGTFFGLRLVAGGPESGNAVVQVDEWAVTPLEDFAFPTPVFGAPVPRPRPLAPPPPAPAYLLPGSMTFTNAILVLPRGGGGRSQIRYTTDGTAPGPDSPAADLYHRIRDHAVFQSQVFLDGKPSSGVARKAYFRTEPLLLAPGVEVPEGSAGRCELTARIQPEASYLVSTKLVLSAPAWEPREMVAGCELIDRLARAAADEPDRYFLVQLLRGGPAGQGSGTRTNR